MRIYLDCCCLNRLFDDHRQARVRIEAEAVLSILEEAFSGMHLLIGSPFLEFEISGIRDATRRAQLAAVLNRASERVSGSSALEAAAAELRRHGFHRMDALHIAAAQAAKADVFLTVDDRLLRKARGCALISVLVDNPCSWLAGGRGIAYQ